MSDISFCRYDWKHERGDWVIEINKDTDGHLNLYITNIKSDDLYEIDGDQHGEELHYRITTTEIEEAYRCLLYTSPSPRDKRQSRMPSSA